MQVDAAVRTIAEFWEGRPLRWAGGGPSYVERLEKQFGTAFPEELRTYIRDYAPKRRLTFDAVGNPFDVYGQSGRLQRLGFQQPGFSEDIDGWDRNWFLFADEGLDPIIVDLSRGDTQIQQAWHGEGEWDFSEIADTIGQFLLCAAALHHTLNKWHLKSGDAPPPEAAAWLLPRMRDWAGPHYDYWCGLLE